GGNGTRVHGAGGSGGKGAGGGLDILSSSTANLANTLIAENGVTAGTEGRGRVNGSAGSTSGPDVSGNVASSDHDLVGNGSGSNRSGVDSGGDLVGYTAAQLHLGSLANNGGPLAGAPGSQQVVSTIALLPGSPAVDKGDSNARGLPSTDQRGFARISGSA